VLVESWARRGRDDEEVGSPEADRYSVAETYSDDVRVVELGEKTLPARLIDRGADDLVGERELESFEARLGDSVEPPFCSTRSTARRRRELGVARSVRLEPLERPARSVDDACDGSLVSPLAPTATPLAQRVMSSRLDEGLLDVLAGRGSVGRELDVLAVSPSAEVDRPRARGVSSGRPASAMPRPACSTAPSVHDLPVALFDPS